MKKSSFSVKIPEIFKRIFFLFSTYFKRWCWWVRKQRIIFPCWGFHAKKCNKARGWIMWQGWNYFEFWTRKEEDKVTKLSLATFVNEQSKTVVISRMKPFSLFHRFWTGEQDDYCRVTFWPLLYKALFLEAAGAVTKIGSKHHNQI